MRELSSIWKWLSWLNSMEDPAREEILDHGRTQIERTRQLIGFEPEYHLAQMGY